MKKLNFIILILAFNYCIAKENRKDSEDHRIYKNIDNVELNTFSGEINISPDYDTKTVEILISGKDLTDVERKIKNSGKDLNVDIKYARNLSNLTAINNPQLKINIHVPRSVNLRIKNFSGKINMAGNLTGNIYFKTIGGQISIDTVRGDGSITTLGGSVKINKIDGNIEVTTKGGKLDISSLSGRSILNTSGGELRVGNYNGKGKLSSFGGSVIVENLLGGNLEIKATNSKLSFNKAAGYFDISIESFGGKNELIIPDEKKDISLYITSRTEWKDSWVGNKPEINGLVSSYIPLTVKKINNDKMEYKLSGNSNIGIIKFNATNSEIMIKRNL